MNPHSEEQAIQVLTGAREMAQYRDPLITSYRGNPLIEALPPILSREEVGSALARYPAISAEERLKPSQLRLHMIADVQQFFEPLPVHLELEEKFSRMIRTGYLARNPLAQNQWRELDGRIQALRNPSMNHPFYRATASGFSIIGIPGGGKTTSVEEILGLYPQVIDHSAYHAEPFNRIQVVWLKLACPFDGSVKGFCRNFLDGMDDILGTHYHNDYSVGRSTVDDLLPAMARVASIHCLGVLVIDEIQHLSASKSGGTEKMLNFFVQLINIIGLPVVLIGTYKALPILTSEFRQIRRGCGQGDLIWERMKNDELWLHFLESLWRYQYTREVVVLTQELRDTLYDECQGICDFAVKMFMLAQARAIVTGFEQVTPEIIRSVARESFKTAQPVLKALRDGDMNALKLLDDVHPVDFNSAVLHHYRNAVLQQKDSPGALLADVEASEQPKVPQAPSTPGNFSKPEPLARGRRRGKATAPPGSLMAISAAGQAKGVTPYDSLKAAGFIKPAVEFLEGGV